MPNRSKSLLRAGQIALIGVVGAMTTTPALGQGTAWDHPTLLRTDAPAGNGTYGRGALGAGDLNGDGTADLIVAAPFSPGAGSGVYAYSGVDGSLLYQFPPPSDLEIAKADLDCADFDQDGHDDVLFGWASGLGPNGVKVVVWSGRTGEVMHSLTNPEPEDFFGEEVAALGDVNMDGFPDFVVGASDTDLPGKPYAGKIYVYSGIDGKRINEREGPNAFDNFGHAVANAGDHDGDGIDDVAVGLPGFDVGVFNNVGGACILSGLDLSQINCHYVVGDFQQYGSSVANAGDVDGDGKPNLIVGANITGDYAGAAYVLDSNYDVLYQYIGTVASGFLGDSVRGAGDVNEDGLDDFLFYASRTAGSNGRGTVFLHSGADGSLLATFEGKEDGYRVFPTNRRPTDFDGDGVPEILLGQMKWLAPGPDGEGSGHVVRFRNLLEFDSIELSATSGVNVTGTLDFPSQDAGSGYALLASISGTGPVTLRGGIDIPLTRDAIFQRMIQGRIPPLFRNARGSLGPEGDAAFTIFSRSRLESFIGTTLYFAAVSHDGSNALRVSLAHSVTIVE